MRCHPLPIRIVAQMRMIFNREVQLSIGNSILFFIEVNKISWPATNQTVHLEFSTNLNDDWLPVSNTPTLTNALFACRGRMWLRARFFVWACHKTNFGFQSVPPRGDQLTSAPARVTVARQGRQPLACLRTARTMDVTPRRPLYSVSELERFLRDTSQTIEV